MNPQPCFFTDQIPLSRDDKLKVNTGGRERKDLNMEGVGILYSSIQVTLLEPIFIKSKPSQPLHNPNLTSVHYVTWSLEIKSSETKNCNNGKDHKTTVHEYNSQRVQHVCVT